MHADPIIVAAVMCFAAFIKGMIGFGFPITAISLLSFVMPIETALALLVAPMFFSNLFLIIKGHHYSQTFVRFWPLIVCMVIGIFLGAHILVGLSEQSLFLILGTIIVLLLGLEKLNGQIHLPAKFERPVSIPLGFVCGLIAAVSSAYGPPLVFYLKALKLDKDLFISVISTIFFSGSIFLAIAYSNVNILNGENALWSLLAVIPVMLGLWIGKHFRNRIPQATFYHFIEIALAIIAINLIRKGLF